MTESALWYATRATGVISLLLFTLVAVLGIATAGRAAPTAAARALVAGLHRSAALLALAFLAVHVVGAVADGYVDIGLFSVLVPFTSAYEPVWVGLGTVALDLLVAVALTSLLRTRVPARAWRLVHRTAYLMYPIAVLHGLGTGSDLGSGLYLGAALVSVAVVAVAAGWRLTRRSTPDRHARIAAAYDAGRVAAVSR